MPGSAREGESQVSPLDELGRDLIFPVPVDDIGIKAAGVAWVRRVVLMTPVLISPKFWRCPPRFS